MLCANRFALLALPLLGVLASGPAIAKKANLNGASASLDGKYTFKLTDGSSRFGCKDRSNTDLNATFSNGRVTGDLAGRFFDGAFSRSGPGGRKLKVKLSAVSKDDLAAGLGDLLDACIGTFGTRVTNLRKVTIKGSINKKATKLKITVKVDFRGRGNGLLHNLKGDDKDLYILKVRGPLSIAPPP